MARLQDIRVPSLPGYHNPCDWLGRKVTQMDNAGTLLRLQKIPFSLS